MDEKQTCTQYMRNYKIRRSGRLANFRGYVAVVINYGREGTTAVSEFSVIQSVRKPEQGIQSCVPEFDSSVRPHLRQHPPEALSSVGALVDRSWRDLSSSAVDRSWRDLKFKFPVPVQRRFREKYDRAAPDSHTIVQWHKYLLENGDFQRHGGGSRKRTSDENVEAIREAFTRSPRKSVRQASQYAIRKVQDNRQGLELNELHRILVYADDLNMLGDYPQTIGENTEILLEASKAISLEVNPKKTKYMIMSRDQNIVLNRNIKIGDLSFEEVEKFKYLGATVTNINDTREDIKRRINMGNACYYSVAKILSSSLLSKNLKVRIYKTVVLPVALYGCETWTLTLREEQGLRVFENKVFRKIFEAKRDEVTGEWRKLHNTELHALYSSLT
ncbi:hypothetical protein ANN_01723 [Periplaneta americana]|uniref:Reverse transcriptase domain-containing protein n=1 Tax=Periplaneta americana TaxID=6978 RepID=A0ABQ8TWR7_PERAM|nr:hypothetical protein ANN_01723 [Periplaneta americana]